VAIVGRGARGMGAHGTSAPRCTTRTARAPCSRASAAPPSEFESTSRAAPKPRRTASGQRRAVQRVSPPWSLTTSGACGAARRTASAAGTA
jgi:hypothetical protein